MYTFLQKYFNRTCLWFNIYFDLGTYVVHMVALLYSRTLQSAKIESVKIKTVKIFD